MRLRAFLAALAIVAGVGAVTIAEAQNQKSTPRSAARKSAAPAAPVAPPAPIAPPSFFTPAGTEPLSFAVQTYAAFQSDFSDLRNGGLRTQADLYAALDRTASYNRYHLARGIIAYGALTAAQSAPFVSAVRETAAFYGRDSFIQGLKFDNGYARTMKGASDAEQLLLAALSGDGNRVFSIGAAYRQMAVDLKSQRWAGTVAARMDQRARAMNALSQNAPLRGVSTDAAAKLAPSAASATPRQDPTAFGGLLFWDTLRQPPGTTTAVQTAMSISPPIAAVVPEDRTLAINQIMTLAALYALGATQDANVPVGDLLTEDRTVACFSMVQAQLSQCTSAAHFHYEAAFCLAEQGMENMGKCIRDGRLNQ